MSSENQMAPRGITTMVIVSFMILFSDPCLGTVTKLKYRSEMQLQRDRFYWCGKEGNVQLKGAVHLLLYLSTLASNNLGGTLLQLRKMS